MSDTYNIQAVRQLVCAIFFHQENALYLFCKKELACTLPEGLPFLWNVELLLMHCQAADACPQLLALLKAKDEQQYTRYREAIQQSASPVSDYAGLTRLTCQMTFKKPLDFSEWSDTVQSAAIRALSALMACPPELVRCKAIPEDVRQSAGPVKLTVEMPEKAFERLLDLGDTNEPILNEAGIAQFKEIVRNPHNLDNIRRMLAKMFTLPQLQAFCQKHFPAISAQVAAAVQKSEMIDLLLAHAQENARIPHILVFAKQQHAKIYARFEPYYHAPRIYPTPQQHAGRRRVAPTPLRQPLFNLTFSQAIKAFGAATGVASALVFLLQRVMLIPIADQNVAEVRELLWGTTALFAIVIARAALWGANRQRGVLLASISVASYWLGMIIGNALAYLSIGGVGFQLEFALTALLYGAITAISPLFSFGAPLIVVIIGTYWAYHYSR